MHGTPAAEIGLEKGTKILAIGGHEVDSHNSFLFEIGRLKDMMTAAKTSADSMAVRTTTLVFATGDKVDTVSVVLTPELTLGFAPKGYPQMYEPTHEEFGFFASFPAGVDYGIGVLKGYVSDLRYLFSADGAKSLGGFGSIGKMFPPVWDWHMFWLMTAFLSIILAFMNILPIPALDGGHVLFLIYEMITGKAPSEKFMIYAEYIGIGILMLLMIVANLNDILRWLGYM
jgi:regulator of sigma E protease